MRQTELIKLILQLLLITCLIGKSYGQENGKSVFNKTDAYIESTIDSLKIIGLNYVILVDNKVVHKKSFGSAHAQLKAPMTIDKSFPVASISKLFSSVALHKLLSIYKRDVNETVEGFLPNRNDLPET